MKIKINKNVLCVLKKKEANSSLWVDFVEVKIKKSLAKYLVTFSSFYKEEYLAPKKIIDFIKNDNRIKLFLDDFNYCYDLEGTYQKMSGSEININDLVSRNTSDTNSRKQILQLRHDVENAALPYALKQTYKKCKRNSSIIAYSHSKVGWAQSKYNLGNSLSIQFKTNFGYGRSSYFYTILKFENIKIIPFSEWVLYRNAHKHEIIRYSAKHPLENRSWLDAMEYARDAYNLLLNDRSKFIDKFIIDECRKMVLGLDQILHDNMCFIHEIFPEYKNIKANDSLLIEFKGEKISGALSFIKKIIKFENLFDAKEVITKIEEYNKIIQPILQNELFIINKKLLSITKKMKKVKTLFEKLSNENNVYTRLIIAIHKIFSKKHPDAEKEIIMDCFYKKYPQYQIFQVRFLKVVELYHKTCNEVNQLENIVRNISKYNNVIKDYFSNTTIG
ncbi:MAG: hypothetical protein M0Q21_04030 [Ignavibacteriaceae bacterium]|nr:hypothetical protein [Ignavibacteriaceae bacterium]